MSENNKTNWKEREIGALWKAKSGNGYNGKIEVGGKQYSVVLFDNKFKTAGSNQPDVKVYLGDETPKAATPQRTVAKTAAKPAPATQVVGEDDAIF